MRTSSRGGGSLHQEHPEHRPAVHQGRKIGRDPRRISTALESLLRGRVLLGSGGPSPPSSVLRSPSCRCPSTSSLLARGCLCVYPPQGDVGIGSPSQLSSV